MKLLIKLLTFTIFTTSCCSYNKKDFVFNANDLRPLSSYKQGDTIYYENASGDLDTIMIYQIDSIQHTDCGGLIARGAENYLFVAIKHLPNDKMWTGTSTEGGTGKTEITYQNIITIDKRPQMKEMDYAIEFKDFYSFAGVNKSIGKLRTDTLIINGKSITNFYEIQHEHPERVTEPTNIELVCWTDNDGMLAYKTKAGDWWIKKRKH